MSTAHPPEPQHATSGEAPALVRALVRKRTSGLVSLILLIAGIAMIGILGEAAQTPRATDPLPVGYDSTRVVELEQRFDDSGTEIGIVLYAKDTPLQPDEVAALEAPYAQIGETEGTTGMRAVSPLQVSEDGTAALGVVAVPDRGESKFGQDVENLRDQVRQDLPPGITGQVTGPAGIQADIGAVFEGADLRLLMATALIVALLLLITYRSPLLWLIPLTVVAVADRAAVSAGTHVLRALDLAWNGSTTGIMSVLVFGAGTNYALLLISRYRDELRHHEDRFAAMRRAVTRTGEAILASATTVFGGLLLLVLSAVPITRGLGVAGAVGIAIAAFSALVVLPGALVVFGRWIFWPLVPHVVGDSAVTKPSVWRRIGDGVARRPLAAIAGALVVLLALGSGTAFLRIGLDPSEQFLQKPEAITASERLAQSFPAGSSNPVVVITTGDPEPVVTAVSEVRGVASARPDGAAEDAALNRISVVLEAAAGSERERQTVEQIRSSLDAADLGAGTYVGGTAAQTLDANAAGSRDRLLLMPLILGLVLLALFALLRSVVAPILLVATVVATYVAAMGAGWWIFTSVLDFGALGTDVPLYAFLFLVALGVDYNIFLVTRAAQEARMVGAREGMLRALGATGGVITSAGILLAAVFAVLGVLPLVVLAQIGTVICIGVLLDTLLVRTVLVPALGQLLGDRFWWPRKLLN